MASGKVTGAVRRALPQLASAVMWSLELTRVECVNGKFVPGRVMRDDSYWTFWHQLSVQCPEYMDPLVVWLMRKIPDERVERALAAWTHKPGPKDNKEERSQFTQASKLLAEMQIEPRDKDLTHRTAGTLKKQWSEESNNPSIRELRTRLGVTEKRTEARRLRIALGLAGPSRDESDAAIKEASYLVTCAFINIVATGLSCTDSAKVLRHLVQEAAKAGRRVSRAEVQPKHGRRGRQNPSKVSAP